MEATIAKIYVELERDWEYCTSVDQLIDVYFKHAVIAPFELLKKMPDLEDLIRVPNPLRIRSLALFNNPFPLDDDISFRSFFGYPVRSYSPSHFRPIQKDIIYHAIEDLLVYFRKASFIDKE